jgi:hypothetical protein
MPKTCSGLTRPQNMRVQFRSRNASIDPSITGLSSAAARTSSPMTTRCSGRRIGHLHRVAHPIEPSRHDPKVERRQPHCCLPTSMRSTIWSPGCSGAVMLPIEPGRRDPKVERHQPRCRLSMSMRSTLWSPGCSGAVSPRNCRCTA